MNVRLANLDDMDKLIKVRFDYFSAEGSALTDEQKDKMSTQLQEYYSKHLNQDFFAALIEDELGNVLSSAFMVVFEKPANLSWPTGKTGLILNVFTYPPYRKMGYATSTLSMWLKSKISRLLSFQPQRQESPSIRGLVLMKRNLHTLHL